MNLADHIPWLRRLASRFHPNEQDDCVQVGLLVVAKKIGEFDATRGIKFTTFAGARVLGAMQDHMRDPYRNGKRIPPSMLRALPTLRRKRDGRTGEHKLKSDAPGECTLPAPAECEPLDIRVRRVLHGKVRHVELARCRCGAPFWRRLDTPHVLCSRSCRHNLTRICTACGVQFRKWRPSWGAWPARCRECAQQRRKRRAS